jgi:IS4 transposase
MSTVTPRRFALSVYNERLSNRCKVAFLMFAEDAGPYTIRIVRNVLPALTIAELYRSRWQVELFFRWIKQHLRIKSFFGTSANAVRTQIWIAISVYVLVAIAKKRLQIDRDLHSVLQVLSVSLFEKIEVSQLLTSTGYTPASESVCNQLPLFNF